MTGFSDSFNDNTKAAIYGLMDDAVWIKKSGGAIEIKVEFTNDPLKDELGNIITIDNPIAGAYIEDTPGIQNSDMLSMQDVQYKIIEVIPTGDGMQDIYLRKLD